MNLKWQQAESLVCRWELVIDDSASEDDGVLMAEVTRQQDRRYIIIWWADAETSDCTRLIFNGGLKRAKAYAVALVKMA